MHKVVSSSVISKDWVLKPKKDRTQKPKHNPTGPIAWRDIRLSVQHEIVGLSLLSELWLLKSKEERRFRNHTTFYQDK